MRRGKGYGILSRRQALLAEGNLLSREIVTETSQRKPAPDGRSTKGE